MGTMIGTPPRAARATVGDLTPNDVGRHVQVTTPDTQITGTLRGFHVNTDWISDQTYDRPDTETPGACTVTVDIGQWTSRPLAADTPVRFDVVPPRIDPATEAALTALHRATTSPAEFTRALEHAVTIAQSGGIEPRMLDALLHLANVRQLTPGVTQLLTNAGIDLTPWDAK